MRLFHTISCHRGLENMQQRHMAIRLQKIDITLAYWQAWAVLLTDGDVVTRCEKASLLHQQSNEGSQRFSNKAQWGCLMEATWRCYFCWVMLSFRRTVVFLKSNEVTIPALMLRFHPLDLWTSLVSIHFASQQKAKAGCVGHIQPALLLLVWMQLGCYLNPTSAGHFSVISPWNGESWTGNATSHSYRIISCLFFLFFFILFK